MDTSHIHSHGPALANTHHQDQGDYAFLNHSAATLPLNLPPNVDDRPLARQKRKRTSPEDQAVLEAAYNRDPKPDKAARVELVRQVSLGEKEVQIWFQNRRQSSRRKSRPLLPHEIAQYQLARSGQASHGYESESAAGDGLDTEERHGKEEGSDEAHVNGLHPSSTPANGLRSSNAAPEATNHTATEPTSRTSPLHSDQNQSDLAVPLSKPQPPSHAPTTAILDQGGHHVGYLANRRSASSLALSQTNPEARLAGLPSGEPIAAEPERRLTKTSSYVGLSMSFDGNATVVTKDGSSPSPPRASQVMLPATNGSSIVQPQSSGDDQTTNFAARNNMQRSTSGRSRDSRAWEFWCDKDARTELEDKAEKDSSGSAADAIGLLRSASGRSILGAVPTKRNSLLSRHPSDLKRSRLESKRPPLQRSHTSFGRLQGKPKGVTKPQPEPKYSESALSIYIPGSDSDKENWSPNSERPTSGLPSSYVASMRQTQPERAVLGESRNAGNASMPRAFGRGLPKPSKHESPDDENGDPEKDAELAAFMRSGGKSNSTSSEDDLDCVQGLLSLSQGNWR